LGLPDETESPELWVAIQQARRRQKRTEVRIGVGPLASDVPLRVIGHGMCVADALRLDLPAIIRPADQIAIFSSAPKARNFDLRSATRSLIALSGSLRLAGTTCPITIDLASERQEIPESLLIEMPQPLTRWLERAAAHSMNNIPPRLYAIEHASASMFGDLDPSTDPPLRITMGSAPEARFWAARRIVRRAALHDGIHLAPAVGLILRTLEVPWYSPTPSEPDIATALRDPEMALEKLDDAANPQKPDGNSGLKREARASRRQMERRSLAVYSFLKALSDLECAIHYAVEIGVSFGLRLRQRLGGAF
jgi:hypothetical protein